MKSIQLVLSGTTLQAVSELAITMQGLPTVQRAAIVFSNGKPGALENDGTNNFIYLQNILTGLNYFETNSKYEYTVLQTGFADGFLPQTIAAVKKNGISVAAGKTLNFTVTAGNLILVISKTQGAPATYRSSGNSLVYIAGVDADNSKNFNIYEVAQTVDSLFALFTTGI
jgi:hypothetical protein